MKLIGTMKQIRQRIPPLLAGILMVFLAGSLLTGLAWAVFGRNTGNPSHEQASAMDSSGFPEPVLPGLPGFTPLEALAGPIRIGIQPGHWRIDELPANLARLRTSTGAAFGSLRELDLNMAVSRLLVDSLNAAGYQAELVPAAIPPGYRADLFVSVHADRADRPDRQGWKLSPPWRPSRRSTELAEAFSVAFRASGLPQDHNGITANMRGYFGFSWWRYDNVMSPYTPAVLVEMGFMGNAEDRARMRDRPEFYADIMLRGIELYLADYDREDLDALTPVLHPVRSAGASGVAARGAPSFGSAILERYEAGRRLMPVDTAGDGWYEVFSRGLWQGVWIHESELD
jgi:N-acetylmuramoyl-L-alanine amidase